MNYRKFDGVLLASGGMDSTVLAYKLLNENKKILPVFLNYGQHCADTEYERFMKLLPKEYTQDKEILDISDIYKHSTSRMIKEANLWKDEITASDLLVPYRNLLFLTVAAAFAATLNIPFVYAAFINSNHAKEIDCSARFFNSCESLIGNIGSVTIEMPFRELTKYEVARIGLSLDVPIESSFSCQVNAISPCGACPNCVDRMDALSKIFEEEKNG